MTALTAFFQALLDLSLTALPVMGAVLLARFCLRPAPKKYSYVLWAVVAFRLVCPVSLPSPMSLFNSAPVQAAQETAQSVIREFGQTAIPLLSDHTAHSTPAAPQNAPQVITTMAVSPMEVLALLWVVGLGAMLIWAVISDLRIRRNVAQAVRLEDGVFQCDGLRTPFVLGCFRPKIYVPFRMEPGELAHILLHERTHLRRGDPWWKLLGFGILAVYWWNPAVWLCHSLFCRDMEMSCDEAVLRKLGPEVKQLYSLSLVSFAAGRHFPATGPLAFGENDAKSRVKNILRWKRAAPAAVFLATALCILAAVICGTNADTSHWLRWKSGSFDTVSSGTVAYTYRTGSDVQYLSFYEDVYEGGILTDSHFILSEGVAGEEWKSNLSLSLSAAPELSWTLRDGGAVTSWTTLLHDDSYSGRTVCIPDAGKQTLNGGSNLVLAAVYQETAFGGTEIYPAPCETVLQDLDKVISMNDVVVLIRLEASDVPPETAPIASVAQRLFSLRNPYVGDVAADGKLLDALGVGDLGNYKLELFTAERPYILQINFQNEPSNPDALGAAMFEPATLLLSLIDNLEEIRWTYPKTQDGKPTLVTVYFNEDNAACPAGMAIKDCGANLQNLQTLLDYLGADTGAANSGS